MDKEKQSKTTLPLGNWLKVIVVFLFLSQVISHYPLDIEARSSGFTDQDRSYPAINLSSGDYKSSFELAVWFPGFDRNLILLTELVFVDCEHVESVTINLTIENYSFQETFNRAMDNILLNTFSGLQKFAVLVDDSSNFKIARESNDIPSILHVPVTIIITPVQNKQPSGKITVQECELQTFNSDLIPSNGDPASINLPISRFVLINVSKTITPTIKTTVLAFPAFDLSNGKYVLTIQDNIISPRIRTRTLITIKTGSLILASVSNVAFQESGIDIDIFPVIGVRSLIIEIENVFSSSIADFNVTLEFSLTGRAIINHVQLEESIRDFTPNAFLLSSILTIGIPCQIGIRRKLGKMIKKGE